MIVNHRFINCIFAVRTKKKIAVLPICLAKKNWNGGEIFSSEKLKIIFVLTRHSVLLFDITRHIKLLLDHPAPEKTFKVSTVTIFGSDTRSDIGYVH